MIDIVTESSMNGNSRGDIGPKCGQPKGTDRRASNSLVSLWISTSGAEVLHEMSS
jgi:hypothetical protein